MRNHFFPLVKLLWMASIALVFVGSNAKFANAQQGKYLTEATIRLVKLINAGNKAGYKLSDDSFSVGGGWIKQGRQNWVPLFNITLRAGRSYRFLAAGDADTKDLDIQVLDPAGNIVAKDVLTAADAIVTYRPARTGKYQIRLRLYSSVKNYPCLCLAVMMAK